MQRSSLGRIGCGVAVTVFALSTSAFPSGDDLEKRVVTEFCVPTDDPAAHKNRLLKIELLGEKARRALLKVASSKKLQARCALQYLFDLKDQRAIPIIRKILRDSHTDIGMQESAIAGVGIFKDMASFDRVLQAFQSGDRNLAGTAAITLGKLGDERGLRALREALLSPRYEKVQGAIVRGVGVRGHEAAIDLLLTLVDDPAYKKYGFLRSELVLSLGRIGTPRSRRLAVDLYGDMKDEYLRGGLSLDLFGVLLKQRTQSRDESEIRDINEQMSRLRADPGASKSIKTIP